jgi:hypothetical protein
MSLLLLRGDATVLLWLLILSAVKDSAGETKKLLAKAGSAGQS